VLYNSLDAVLEIPHRRTNPGSNAEKDGPKADLDFNAEGARCSFSINVRLVGDTTQVSELKAGNHEN